MPLSRGKFAKEVKPRAVPTGNGFAGRRVARAVEVSSVSCIAGELTILPVHCL